MDRKILIVYIATGDYVKMFKEFYDTLCANFCPDVDKVLEIWTDQIDLFWEYVDFDCTVNLWPHQPWPINALMKFDIIKRSIDKNPGVTNVFYFNSNLKFTSEIKSSEVLCDKIVCCKHYAYGDAKAWAFSPEGLLKEGITGPEDFFTYQEHISKKFSCYIEGHYDYVQSGMEGGPVDKMIKVCDQINRLTAIDLSRNRIPPYHDESYFNYVVHQNPEMFKILDNDYLMYEPEMYERGYPNAKIILRDASATQSKYKDNLVKLAK